MYFIARIYTPKKMTRISILNFKKKSTFVLHNNYIIDNDDSVKRTITASEITIKTIFNTIAIGENIKNKTKIIAKNSISNFQIFLNQSLYDIPIYDSTTIRTTLVGATNIVNP